MPDVKPAAEDDARPEVFDDVTKVGVRKVFGKQVMNMDMLQDELTKRRVTKEITTRRRPR